MNRILPVNQWVAQQRSDRTRFFFVFVVWCSLCFFLWMTISLTSWVPLLCIFSLGDFFRNPNFKRSKVLWLHGSWEDGAVQTLANNFFGSKLSMCLGEFRGKADASISLHTIFPDVGCWQGWEAILIKWCSFAALLSCSLDPNNLLNWKVAESVNFQNFNIKSLKTNSNALRYIYL